MVLLFRTPTRHIHSTIPYQFGKCFIAMALLRVSWELLFGKDADPFFFYLPQHQSLGFNQHSSLHTAAARNQQVTPSYVGLKLSDFYHLRRLTVLTIFQPFWQRCFWNCLRTSAALVPLFKWISRESFRNKEAWTFTVLDGWKMKGVAWGKWGETHW